MGINSHPQILLCQEQVQSLRRSNTSQRRYCQSTFIYFAFPDYTDDVQIENVYQDQLRRNHILEKAASGCVEGFLLRHQEMVCQVNPLRVYGGKNQGKG